MAEVYVVNKDAKLIHSRNAADERCNLDDIAAENRDVLRPAENRKDWEALGGYIVAGFLPCDRCIGRDDG